MKICLLSYVSSHSNKDSHAGCMSVSHREAGEEKREAKQEEKMEVKGYK